MPVLEGTGRVSSNLKCSSSFRGKDWTGISKTLSYYTERMMGKGLPSRGVLDEEIKETRARDFVGSKVGNINV